MNFNNTYRIYSIALIENHNPGRTPLSLLEGIKEASHMLLLQQRKEGRNQAPEHPASVRDLRDVHDSGYGRKKRKDANGVVHTRQRSASIMQIVRNTKVFKESTSMACTPVYIKHPKKGSMPMRKVSRYCCVKQRQREGKGLIQG